MPNSKLRQLYQAFILALALSPIAFFFQNCGEGFQPIGTIDNSSLAAPAVAFDTALPATMTSQNSATINFAPTTGSGVISSYECRLDNATYVACTSPMSLTSLTDGAHVFYVRARSVTDQLSSEISHAWTVDTVAPAIQINAPPAALTSATNVSVAFTASDVTSGVDRTECALDAAAFATCTSPFTAAGLAQGNHTLRMRVFDRVGNISTVTQLNWQIDSAAPAITITGRPQALTNLTTATFTFTGAATYQCRLDAQAAEPCTSPKVYNALAAGNHVFTLIGTSAAGVASAPAVYNWAINNTPPVLTITSQPTNPSNSRTATFAFNATVAAGLTVSYTCSLDGGAPVGCTSPTTYNNLIDGNHSFTVTARDNLGNVSAPRNYAWAVLVAPTISITGQPPALTNLTTATFTFSGAATYTCRLDAQTAEACTSPKVYTGLAAGNHTFTLLGTSAAGVASSPAVYNWTVNIVPPPVITVGLRPAILLAGASINLSVTATGAGLTYQWAKNDVNIPGATNATYRISPLTTDSAGLYKVTVSNLGGSAISVANIQVIDFNNILFRSGLRVSDYTSLEITHTGNTRANSRRVDYFLNSTVVFGETARQTRFRLLDMVIADDGNYAHQFEQYMIEVSTYTPRHLSAVTSLNNNAYCGLTGWQLNVPKSLIGTVCEFGVTEVVRGLSRATLENGVQVHYFGRRQADDADYTVAPTGIDPTTRMVAQ